MIGLRTTAFKYDDLSLDSQIMSGDRSKDRKIPPDSIGQIEVLNRRLNKRLS